MRKAAVAFTAVLLAAACANGGGSSPPPTIGQKTKDQLAVDSSVLQMSDLPGTWNTNRPASTASDSLPSRDDVLTAADVCFPTTDGITATTAREFLSGPTLATFRAATDKTKAPAAVPNTAFGTFSRTLSPREIQLGMRLVF